jgi:hypothetical protein
LIHGAEIGVTSEHGEYFILGDHSSDGYSHMKTLNAIDYIFNTCSGPNIEFVACSAFLTPEEYAAIERFKPEGARRSLNFI